MNLRRLGLRRSVPLPSGHPMIGQECLYCKLPICAGDRTTLIPNPDSREPAWLDGKVCHWICVRNSLNRRRQAEVPPNATRRFLELQAAYQPGCNRGARYTSEADFILKNGRAFEKSPSSDRVRMGRPRECFRNAANLALRKPDLYTYVEGYAVNKWVPIRPAAHAWCIDPQSFVIDPTWDEGTEYFGVVFRHDYLRRILKGKRDYGLIANHEMDYPLVTGEHRVDEALISSW